MSVTKNYWILKTKYFGFIIGFIISALSIIGGFSWSIFGDLESKLLTTYFSFKNIVSKESVQKGVWLADTNTAVSSDILIVGIDLKALQKFGAWPFPRKIHADLVNSFSRISNQTEREKALFLDIFFIDNSSSPEYDNALISSIHESKSVFVESIIEHYSAGEALEEEMFARQNELFSITGMLSNVSGDWKSLPTGYGLQTNLAQINAGVKGYGTANIVPDSVDKVVRRQPLLFKYSKILYEFPFEELTTDFLIDEDIYQRVSWFDSKGIEHQIDLPLTQNALQNLSKRIYKEAPPLLYDANGDGTPETETRVIQITQDYFLPSIAFSLALSSWNASLSDCMVVLGKHIQVNLSDGTKKIIPIDANGSMIINFAGHPSSAAIDGYKTYPVRSYSGYVRETSPDPATWPLTRAVKDKIIMVGAFEKGMADDEKQTPYGMMFGIEIHANSLNTMLMDSYIRPINPYVSALLTFISIFCVAFFASRLKNVLSLPFSLIFAFSIFIGSSLLFDTKNILINYSVPFFGMIFTYVTIILYRSSTEERDKRKIKAMFGKYVSPDVVSQMMDHPPELGGVDRELTVFFSDIRGFTSLSETLSPQELVRHLNEYLTAMTDIILETGGTLDKYVGDEIMCFWGAPLEVSNHAFRACDCALKQKKKLEELNLAWPIEKRLAIGIGLNTGVMTVGNMGSAGRMNYTLMGDNVNLGARLEGTNKVYGTMIIVSEYTYALVKDSFIFRELDTIRVKGKNRPVVIFELVDYLQ